MSHTQENYRQTTNSLSDYDPRDEGFDSKIAKITSPQEHALDAVDSIMSLFNSKTRAEIRDIYAIQPYDFESEVSFAAHYVDKDPNLHYLEIASIDGPDTKWVFSGVTGKIESIEYLQENESGEEDKARVIALSKDVQRIINRVVTDKMDEMFFGIGEFGATEQDKNHRKWIGRNEVTNPINSNQSSGGFYS